MKGVDVSFHNGYINWYALKSAGIDFAICRATYGKSNIDETFSDNVNNAHKAGLICGAYHYSYALNSDDALREAVHCKNVIRDSGVLLELPVFFDMEDADGYKEKHNFAFDKRNITEICKVFLDNIKPLKAGIYASFSWLDYLIDWRSLDCPVWNAQWSDKDFIQGYMWQYTDKLCINEKLFDGNIIYDEVDKPKQII